MSRQKLNAVCDSLLLRLGHTMLTVSKRINFFNFSILIVTLFRVRGSCDRLSFIFFTTLRKWICDRDESVGALTAHHAVWSFR